ncbi:MAG: nickel insertion protein, partial [Thermodesulfobacteriota bacterium]|nr:nickel insertion protein [Thermodesulfobacteriota bacterium]
MIAYFDCFSGISGDMTLGAFIDLGVPVKWLKENLDRIPLTGF